MRHTARLLLFALLLAVPLAAQRPTDVVRWSARAAGDAAPGGRLDIEVTAEVQRGWNLYGLMQPKTGPKPLHFAIAAGEPFEIRVKEIKGPAARTVADENFNAETSQHAGKAVFSVPVTIGRGVPAGARTVPLQVTFQACGNGLCLRPFTQTLDVQVTIR